MRRERPSGSSAAEMIAPLRDAEQRGLTEVIEDRTERVSALIAGQLPATDWHAAIGDSHGFERE